MWRKDLFAPRDFPREVYEFYFGRWSKVVTFRVRN